MSSQPQMPSIDRIESAIINIISTSGAQLRRHSSLTRLDSSGGYTNIYFSGFNIDIGIANADTQQLISELGSLGFNKLKTAIHATCVEAYLQTVAISGDPLEQNTLHEVAKEHATNIFWFLKSKPTFRKTIRLFPEIEEISSFNGWNVYQPNTLEYTVEAHQSGQSADHFISRLRHSTLLEQIVDHAPSLEEFQIEAQSIALSLSLALRRPIRIDDIAIQSNPWRHYFLEKPVRMFGAWGISATEARSASFLPKAMRPVGLTSGDFKNQTEAWVALLSKYRGAHYPIGLIQLGFWNIFDSNNYGGFAGRNLAYQGIHFVLTGMDGLTVSAEASQGIGNYAGFWKTWRRIGRAHSKSKGLKNLIRKLYELRNSLAHGDFDSIEPALFQANRVLGDKFNPGYSDAFTVGVQLHQWLSDLMSVFVSDPQLLSELYPAREKVEKKSVGLKLLQFFRMR